MILPKSKLKSKMHLFGMKMLTIQHITKKKIPTTFMKPKLIFLSDSEIKRIHHNAIRILSEIGMRMPHEDALNLLKKAGAEIVDNATVRIPEYLIENALATVPKRDSVTLYGNVWQVSNASFGKSQLMMRHWLLM